MSELAPTNPSGPAQVPAVHDAETADRIQWIVEQIADAGLVVGPLGVPFAGRAKLAEETAIYFEVSRAEAERMIDLAHADLVGQAEGMPAHVERRLLQARLQIVRRHLLKSMGRPRRQIVNKIVVEETEDGEEEVKRVPVEETVKDGLDVNAVRLLIDIEGMIAKLNHLDEPQANGSLVAEIFERLERDSEGKETTTSITSISQRVKSMDIDGLTAGRSVIENAAAQVKQQRRKKVASKPVENAAEGKNDDEHGDQPS
jgi:hypothetical protein